MSLQNNPTPAKPDDQTRLRTGASAGFASVAADESEPTAERRPISVLLIGLLIALLYWGDMYVMEHGADVAGKSGSFPAAVYEPFRSYEEVVKANPRTKEGEMMEKGRLVFENMGCAACHQSSGLGNAATFVPPLAKSEWVVTEGPNRLVRIVLSGLAGPIEVSGLQFGNNTMTAFGAALSDEQIAHVLTYIRNSWGNKAPAVDVAKVKEIRDKTADRQTPWTAPELLQIPDKD